jgi:chromosome segregation ATPase
MNKKEIAQQFTKQILDQKAPSISFEQVTNMLKEIEQTHSKIMSNTEAYRIQHRILESSYSDLRSKLQGLHKPIENLEERLTTSSARLSKYQRSSLWQRYWTAAVVGIISALLTNLLLVIL